MLLNSPATKTKLTLTKYDLPLGILTRKLDQEGDKKPSTEPPPLDYELNPSLPALFREFAYFMDASVAKQTIPTVKLYRDIYDFWIARYVKVNTANGVPPSPADYQLWYQGAALTSTTDLLAAFQTTQAVPSRTLPYMYIGLYMFTVWFLLTKSGVVGQLSHLVKRYVAKKGLEWEAGGVTVHKTFFIQTSSQGVETYQPTFSRAFSPQDTLQEMVRIVATPDSDIPDDPPKSIGSNIKNYLRGINTEDEGAVRAATLAFVKFFRGSLADVLDKEYFDLLSIIDAGMVEKARPPIQFAVGDGSTTMGTFNIEYLKQSFGTLLWRYDLTIANAPNFIVARRDSPSIPVWSAGEDTSSVLPPWILLAQWGADGQRTLTVTPTSSSSGAAAQRHELTIGSDLGSYLDEYAGGGVSYRKNTGTLSFKDKGTTHVSVKSEGTSEEDVVFLLFPHYLGEFQSAERLAFHQTFEDNEFVVPVPDFNQLWQSGDDPAKTRAIVLRLRDIPGFHLRARMSGGGVGRRVKLPQAGVGSCVVTATVQIDDNATKPAENVLKRYGYGEMTWWSKLDVEENVLEFAACGYTSPVTCTWATWSQFQALVTDSTDKKAARLAQELGPHLKKVSGAPSYNTALSAFRAMGMLEAMVCRLQARADALVGTSELASADRDVVNARLQAFLEEVSIPIKQYGRKRESGVDLRYVAPPPPATPPAIPSKTVYYTTYAY